MLSTLPIHSAIVGCLFVTLAIILGANAQSEYDDGRFDPYNALQVSRISTSEEIRRSYKMLALQYHPDRNKDPEAVSRFMEINEAYQVLSDSARRRMYDTLGYYERSSVSTKAGRDEAVPSNSTEAPVESTTWSKFSNRMERIRHRLRESVRQRDILPVVSVIGTVTVMLFLGFILSYFDPANIDKRRRGDIVPRRTSGMVDYKGRLVHELKPQTFNGLIRCLKPGCRSIIILVDNATKEELIWRFGDIVYPYRKNKTLLFGYLNVDFPYRLEWYRRVLQQTLVNLNRRLQLIPHKCIGTVLVLNGMRRYYSIYHAMHRDSQEPRRRHRRRSTGQSRSASTGTGSTAASSLAYDADENASNGSDDTDSTAEVNDEVEAGRLTTDAHPFVDPPSYDELIKKNIIDATSPDYLLAYLPQWLDRLFGGNLQRYYISTWPNMK